MEKSSLSSGIKTIATVNCIASVITLFFWVLVLLKIFITSSSGVAMDPATKASTLGFLIADLIWAVPVLIISIPGLLKLCFWGWTDAQMANILWLYSLTALWTRDIYSGAISPGNIIFLPFALFSIWSAYYLSLNRNQFKFI